MFAHTHLLNSQILICVYVFLKNVMRKKHFPETCLLPQNTGKPALAIMFTSELRGHWIQSLLSAGGFGQMILSSQLQHLQSVS